MSLSTSEKEFVALGAAIGAGCHPCTQYHTQATLKADLGVEDILWAVEQARAVRATGGVAVTNVGGRILGAEQQELPAHDPLACRGSALVALGAAAGCNSGVLLAEYAEQAVGLGLRGDELREAVDIAEMVKTQAGKFLQRDAERALGSASEAAGAAAPAAGCCSSEGTAEVGEAVAGAVAGGQAPACGCGSEQ